MKTFDAAMLWTPDGWRADAGLTVDEHGRIVAIETAEPTASARWIVPGIANLHSHAFQRAMAGMAERQTNPLDSFWTWRETMYRFAARFDPDTLKAVAAQVYAEMLEAGYTTVCEFHYLHHGRDGRPYADPAEMSRALVAAARETGIRLTLLPVLYMTGGQFKCPIVFRGPTGAALQLSAQHSQALEASYVHFPGIKVVVPGTPADAKGLLKAAIRDDDPVVVLEAELLYALKGEVPDDEDFIVPLGVADVKREGTDVSLITHGKMIHTCLQAADRLAKEQISAEVIDLRSLRPLGVRAEKLQLGGYRRSASPPQDRS